MRPTTKNVTVTAMLCALTYLVMAVGRIPVVLFLKYDPSDVVVTLGGLIWGPMTACAVSVVVAVLEMVTVSETGVLGCVMNIVQTLSFAGPACLIYRRRRTLGGAAAGLAAGCGAMIAVICCGAAVIVGLVVFFVVRSRSKKNKTDHNKEQ